MDPQQGFPISVADPYTYPQYQQFGGMIQGQQIPATLSSASAAVPSVSSAQSADNSQNLKEEDSDGKDKRSRGTKRQGKKQKGGLTEDELKERRKKHNEVEIRRRKRIKASFTELGQICNCDSKQKRIILANAIDLIKSYEEKIKSLQVSIESIDQESQAVVPANDPKAPAQSTQVVPQAPNELTPAVDHDAIFYSSGVPLQIAAFDGRILDCNNSFAKIFGYQREQLVEGQNTTLFSLTSPESLSAAFSTVGSLMNGQPSVQTVLTIIGAQGRPRRARLTAWSVRENQKPKYFMGMLLPVVDDTPLSSGPTAAAVPSLATLPSQSSQDSSKRRTG